MKRIITLLLGILGFSGVFCQESSPQVISSGGSTMQGTTMIIEWTLGEAAISSIQNSNNLITQGFHQPFVTITSTNELDINIGEIIVFPNPATDRLELGLKFNQERNVQIQLYDIQGVLLVDQHTNGLSIRENLNLNGFPNGNYILNFNIDQNQYYKSFKVQKIN